MTKAAQNPSFRDIPIALLRNRFLQILVVLATIVEIYNVAVIPSYTSTQKAREVTAVAENTVMRQEAEANLAEAKAINETQVARYAERRQAAEARKANALAAKTKYEAAVAKATADYAEIQAKAEAEAQQLQAELVAQQEQIRTQLNSYVERRKFAEAESAEGEARDLLWWNAGKPGSPPLPSATEVAHECNDKFEALWADMITSLNNSRKEWEVDRLEARSRLYRARCGDWTSAQAQRLEKRQKILDANLEESFCKTDPSYQQEHRQGITDRIGHVPNCRAYTPPLTWQPGIQPVTPAPGAGGTTFRVKSEVSDGKLNLRDGPGMRHAIIAEMPVGALLRQIGACTGSDDGVTRDPWCNVDWNGAKGWASSSGLEKVQDAKASSAAVTPSFDCQTSNGTDERAICSDPALSQLDNQLAQRYGAALQSADAGSANDIRAAQRGWIRLRQACASDVPCLRAQYETRLQQLQR